jgi:hypothetical protein
MCNLLVGWQRLSVLGMRFSAWYVNQDHITSSQPIYVLVYCGELGEVVGTLGTSGSHSFGKSRSDGLKPARPL